MARYGNVDERIVEMQFENQQFEKNANESISTLEKLKKALNLEGAAQGFEEIDKASKGFNFTALQNGVDAIGEKFSMMGILGITAMQRISNAAIDMGVNLGKTLMGLDGISEGFSRYAEKSNHVKTIMTATGESIENVSDVLDDLNWFTDETSYRFTDMVNTMGKFTSAGVKLEVAKEAVEGIALWAAESGQNAQTASRAMFQLAQAYGRGTIQLQDWMSVEQANMSTAKIQNELIEEGGKAAENAIAKYGGFRDSLRSGWLTTEIFNKVMQKYSEGVTEANYENGKFTGGVTKMSEAAFKAAQEARTYKDAIDAVKEAVSTGWSHTFELVFGNAEEAAIVWTDLANALIGVADKFTAFRNDVLEVWNDIGGRDKMVQAAYDMLSGIGKIGNRLGKSFSANLHLGKTLDELKSSEWATTQGARELFDELEELEGQMQNMVSTGVYTTESLEDIQYQIDEVTGSLQAMDRAHMLDNISSKLQEFGRSFKEITNPAQKIEDISKQIQKLANERNNLTREQKKTGYEDSLNEQIAALKKQKEALLDVQVVTDNARRMWEGFLSILKVGKEIFEGFKAGLEPILNVFTRLAKPLVALGGAFGHLVSALNNVLVESGIIKESLTGIGNTIADFLGPIVDFVAKKIERLAEIIDKAAFDIQNGVSPIAGWLESAKKAITDFFGSLDFKLPNIGEGESILGKIVKMWQDFWEGIGPISEKIASVVGNLWEIVKSVFGKLLDILKDVGTQLGLAIGDGGNIIQNLYNFVSAIMQLWLMLSAKWTMDSNPLEAISDALYGLSYKFKGEALKEAAKGLLLIAGALFVVSMIDPDRLLGATAVIEAIIFTLTWAIKQITGLRSMIPDTGSDDDNSLLGRLSKFIGIRRGSKPISQLGEATKYRALAATIASIGAAILMIAASLFVVSKIDTNKMVVSVIAIGAILQMMGAYAKKTKDLTGFKSDGIIKMAAGLYIIAMSIKKLGDLEPEVLIKGVLAMGAVLLEIAGFQALMNKLSRQNLFGGEKGLAGIGAGMILLGAAMLVFARAIRSLGRIPINTLNRGLGTLAAVMAGLVVSMRAMKSTNVVGIAAGMLILSIAIANIAAIIALLGQVEFESLAAGLLTVITAIGALGLVLTLMSAFTNGGNGLLKAAGAILIAAAAMNLLIIPLVVLGHMKLGQIIAGIIGLAGAMLVLGVAAVALSGSELTLMAIGGAMALIGVGMVAIGAGLALISAGIVTTVASIITSINLLVVEFGALIGALATALAAAVDPIALAIGSMGAAILKGLTMIVGPAAELIAALLEAIIEAIGKHLPGVVEALSNLLVNLLDTISLYLPDFINSGINLIVSFVDGLAHGLMDNSDRVLDAFENLIDSIMYFLLDALGRLLSNIPVIGDDISNGIVQMQEDIKNDMKDVGSSTGDTVAEEMAHGRPVVKKEGENYANEFHDGMTETISGGLFSDIPDTIHQYMYSGGTESSGGGTFAADFLQGEKDGILEAIPETFGDGSIATSISQNLMPEDGPQNEIFSEGLNSLFDAGKQTFDDRIPEYLTSGEEIPTQIQTGIGNKEKTTVDKVKTLADNMDKPVSELPGKAKQHTDDAMQGMVDSVDSNWGRVVGKFQALAAACSAALSSVWEEHSPSRVFFRHTTNALLGMVNAVDVNGHMPVDAITNVAQSMVDAVDEKIGQYGSISPTITPVVDLTNATNAAGTIDSMINAQRTSALSAQMSINSQITQMDQLVDMTSRILGAVQNGSDLYLDDSILAGRINRRLGVL